jgi:hypothetical protein
MWRRTFLKRAVGLLGVTIGFKVARTRINEVTKKICAIYIFVKPNGGIVRVNFTDELTRKLFVSEMINVPGSYVSIHPNYGKLHSIYINYKIVNSNNGESV